MHGEQEEGFKQKVVKVERVVFGKFLFVLGVNLRNKVAFGMVFYTHGVLFGRHGYALCRGYVPADSLFLVRIVGEIFL